MRFWGGLFDVPWGLERAISRLIDAGLVFADCTKRYFEWSNCKLYCNCLAARQQLKWAVAAPFEFQWLVAQLAIMLWGCRRFRGKQDASCHYLNHTHPCAASVLQTLNWEQWNESKHFRELSRVTHVCRRASESISCCISVIKVDLD